MIGVLDLVFVSAFGLIGYRLWSGTTSVTARTVSMLCIAYLAWVFVAP